MGHIKNSAHSHSQSLKKTYRQPSGDPPCKAACPVGVDIPRYVRLISEHRFSEALSVIIEKLPFPSICSHICSHPCEAACHVNMVDGPVMINALKRFVVEKAEGITRKKVAVSKSNGRRIAVIGSGPAGLTAAYYLAKLGYAITVFEAAPEPGGMLRYGIPEYRLPKAVLDNEISHVEDLGVEIKTNTPIKKLKDIFDQGYESIFIATGAWQSLKLGVPGEEAGGVLYAFDFLKQVNSGMKVNIGKRITVIGGGSVAIDAARTSLRLGAREVHLVCMECRNGPSKDRMPAQENEIEAAEQEGVIIHPCLGIKNILTRDGMVTGLETIPCISVRDEDGTFAPKLVEGPSPTIDTDNVIIAIGQTLDKTELYGELECNNWGTLSVDPVTLQGNIENVFAGGDAVYGPASAIEAIAAGRKAAMSIDKKLGGDGVIDEAVSPPEVAVTALPPSLPVGERGLMPTLPVAKRLTGFTEVELGLTEEMAIQEAKRCLRCDLPITIDEVKCTGCRICQLRCSISHENAFNLSLSRIKISRLVQEQSEYRISITDQCDDCGICVRYCPYGALTRAEREKRV